MNILIVHEGYAPQLAGAEVMAYETAAHLISLGCQVAILRNGPPAFVIDAQPESAVLLDGLSAASPEEIEHMVIAPPDIVHLIDLTPQAATTALRIASERRCRLVITPASHSSFWRNDEACCTVLQRADRVIALSPREAADLEALGVNSWRIVIIPQGLRIRPKQPSALSVPKPSVLFLGRMMRSKGYIDLLQATEHVWRSAPDTHFLFAGPSIDADVEEHFSKHHDSRIHHFGLVNDETKHALLAGATIFCLPTMADIFPITMLEAWSYGTPVITYDFDGTGEHNSGYGPRLIANQGPMGLARAILQLLGDHKLCGQLSAEGVRLVSTKHQWSEIAETLVRVYQSTLRARASEIEMSL